MMMQESLQGPAWSISTHAACLIQYALDSLACGIQSLPCENTLDKLASSSSQQKHATDAL